MPRNYDYPYGRAGYGPYGGMQYPAPPQPDPITGINFQPYVSLRREIPLDTIAKTADAMQARYDQNVARMDQIDAMLANLNFLEGDEWIKNNEAQNIRNQINEVAKQEDFENAMPRLRQIAKNFANNDILKASQANYASYQKWNEEAAKLRMEGKNVLDFSKGEQFKTYDPETGQIRSFNNPYEEELEYGDKIEEVLDENLKEILTTSGIGPAPGSPGYDYYENIKEIDVAQIQNKLPAMVSMYLDTREGDQHLRVYQAGLREIPEGLTAEQAVANDMYNAAMAKTGRTVESGHFIKKAKADGSSAGGYASMSGGWDYGYVPVSTGKVTDISVRDFYDRGKTGIVAQAAQELERREAPNLKEKSNAINAATTPNAKMAAGVDYVHEYLKTDPDAEIDLAQSVVREANMKALQKHPEADVQMRQFVTNANSTLKTMFEQAGLEYEGEFLPALPQVYTQKTIDDYVSALNMYQEMWKEGMEAKAAKDPAFAQVYETIGDLLINRMPAGQILGLGDEEVQGITSLRKLPLDMKSLYNDIEIAADDIVKNDEGLMKGIYSWFDYNSVPEAGKEEYTHRKNQFQDAFNRMVIDEANLVVDGDKFDEYQVSDKKTVIGWAYRPSMDDSPQVGMSILVAGEDEDGKPEYFTVTVKDEATRSNMLNAIGDPKMIRNENYKDVIMKPGHGKYRMKGEDVDIADGWMYQAPNEDIATYHFTDKAGNNISYSDWIFNGKGDPDLKKQAVANIFRWHDPLIEEKRDAAKADGREEAFWEEMFNTPIRLDDKGQFLMYQDKVSIEEYFNPFAKFKPYAE